MDAVQQLAPTVGIESACDALGVSRASFYRQAAFGPALLVRTLLGADLLVIVSGRV